MRLSFLLLSAIVLLIESSGVFVGGGVVCGTSASPHRLPRLLRLVQSPTKLAPAFAAGSTKARLECVGDISNETLSLQSHGDVFSRKGEFFGMQDRDVGAWRCSYVLVIPGELCAGCVSKPTARKSVGVCGVHPGVRGLGFVRERGQRCVKVRSDRLGEGESVGPGLCCESQVAATTDM